MQRQSWLASRRARSIRSPWKLRPVSCRERNNRRDEPFCCWQWLHGHASHSSSRGLSVYEPIESSRKFPILDAVPPVEIFCKCPATSDSEVISSNGWMLARSSASWRSAGRRTLSSSSSRRAVGRRAAKSKHVGREGGAVCACTSLARKSSAKGKG